MQFAENSPGDNTQPAASRIKPPRLKPDISIIVEAENAAKPRLDPMAVEVQAATLPQLQKPAETDFVVMQPNEQTLSLAGQGDHEASPRQRSRRLDPASFPDVPAPGGQTAPTTIDNVAHLLEEHGILPRYNVVKKKLQVSIPGHSGTVDNLDSSVMTYIISLAVLNGMQVGQVPSMVAYIGDKNAYNPVASWIMSKPWDGVDRLPDFYKTLVEREGYPQSLKCALMYRWALSAVAAVLKPSGFKCRGVLTLQGPQTIGKTSWGMSLVSDPVLAEMVIKVDHHLDGSNKDSILGAVSHWIVEIGELDSSFKKDIARLKGFLTSNFDRIRRPYARAESEYQRRTVFFATVNDRHFLVDQTGNTRWWTIAVDFVDFKHGLDMQQLYAQLAEHFYGGKQWWLTQDEEEMLELYNQQHRSVSVVRALLEEHIDPERVGEEGLPAMTPIKVLKMVGIDRPSNTQCKECGAILRDWLGEPKRIKGEWKYRVPVRAADAFTSVKLRHDDDRY